MTRVGLPLAIANIPENRQALVKQSVCTTRLPLVQVDHAESPERVRDAIGISQLAAQGKSLAMVRSRQLIRTFGSREQTEIVMNDRDPWRVGGSGPDRQDLVEVFRGRRVVSRVIGHQAETVQRICDTVLVTEPPSKGKGLSEKTARCLELVQVKGQVAQVMQRRRAQGQVNAALDR